MKERERGNESLEERLRKKREGAAFSLSVHESIRGNETDREVEGAGTREEEMEDERLRLCHYDKQRGNS